MAQNHMLKLKQPSTHKFPELLPVTQRRGAGLMPFKWVPIAAETSSKCHDRDFGFCPAKSQLYRAEAKPPRGSAESLLLADGR
jgi:hypothetical protein